ncbi:Hira-domain-containing protein [Aulographum hederae CBS 113979]|uniref:Protein HIR n=1 Tax=Aulographum hederae CBS 113979 TaxID=1176131 RepID=A0A6G1GQ12_9PEZI|nr:Hira-domain-containing protein [Aulographum hederae CBS 113979]
MHIIKPGWLVHGGELKDHEVYSCHVSPDGSRLVTAAGDGHVRIWSTEAVLKSADGTYTGPRQLCAISNHSGTIHAVRFSSNGKYLASGADDKIVCVYILDPSPAHGAAFGSNEPPPIENWRVARRLIGHDNDVQDIGWSYDSSILVSVGLDSKVVVWSGSTFEKLKTISIHQSHVKGITFDPANKYFATASDDRSIKVFRFTSPAPNASAHDQVNNFVLETSISAPFTSSPLTTYFRRCSWSPDGGHIAAANAVNGPVSSVAIVNRGSWDSEINLIGHEGPVEVCAFSPRMFHREPYNEAQQQQHGPAPSVTVIACAGQDKTLSVWNTSQSRPFVITQELVGKTISDLAWSPDGETLFLTSLDGSILAAMFEPGELGYPSPMQENERTLSKFGAGRKAGIAEGPDALLLEETSRAGELRGAQGRMGELMGDGVHAQASLSMNGNSGAPRANGTPATAVNGGQPTPVLSAQDQRVNKLKQRVTVGPDGKKRVAPLLVSASSGLAESSLPQTQLMSGSTSQARSDGPQAILDLTKPYDGFPKGGLASLLVGNKRKYAEQEGDEERRMEKRIASQARDGGASIVANGTDGLIPPHLAAKTSNIDTPEVLRPSIVSPALTVAQTRLAVPMVRSIIVRSLDKSTTTGTAGEAPPETDALVLEARNATGPSRTGRPQDRDPARLTCSKAGQLVWQDFLPKSVTLLTGNANFWAASCEDGTLYVWTPAGRRMFPAIILEAQSCILDARGDYLMVITAVGQLHMWNIQSAKRRCPPVSVAPALDIAMAAQGPHLTSAPGIVWARMNSEGKPFLAMSNGDGYVFDVGGMDSWIRLSEIWWAVGSQYWNTTESSISSLSSGSAANGKKTGDDAGFETVTPENLSAGIIQTLERNTTSHTLLRGRAYFLQRLVKALLSAESFENFEGLVSVAHLETRLAGALLVGAREDFKVALTMYARRIAAEGLRGKIEELLRGLMGKVFEDEDAEDAASNGNSTDKMDAGRAKDASRGWQSENKTICGIDRREVLKEVVGTLGKYRDIQRITVPYARILGVVGGEADGTNDVNMGI